MKNEISIIKQLVSFIFRKFKIIIVFPIAHGE